MRQPHRLPHEALAIFMYGAFALGIVVSITYAVAATISVLDRKTYAELDRIRLSLLSGFDRKLKGVQPVGLALSPDG
jgi:hypothetical protein